MPTIFDHSSFTSLTIWYPDAGRIPQVSSTVVPGATAILSALSRAWLFISASLSDLINDTFFFANGFKLTKCLLNRHIFTDLNLRQKKSLSRQTDGVWSDILSYLYTDLFIKELKFRLKKVQSQQVTSKKTNVTRCG